MRLRPVAYGYPVTVTFFGAQAMWGQGQGLWGASQGAGSPLWRLARGLRGVGHTGVSYHIASPE